MISHKKIPYIIVVLFIVLSVLLIINHEPWVDEAQAWLVARDVPNLASLVDQMGYEGSPALWHIILLPFAKSGAPYSSMAVIHFLVMLTAIILFIRNAPFSPLQKFLFVFGYYIFYEYNIIARSYVLTVLILFVIASIYKTRFKRPILYSILLLLLANTNVHSLVFAFLLFAFYVFELRYEGNIRISKNHWAGFIITSLGLLIAIYQLLPPADLISVSSQWNLDFGVRELGRKLGNPLFNAFSPIPEPLVYEFPPKFPGIVGIFFFLLTLGFFVKKRRPMLMYLLMSIGLLGIFLLKHPGRLRHHGLIFVVFVFSLWVAENYEKSRKRGRLYKVFNKKSLSYIFIVLLICQLIGSPLAFYFDFRYDFSASKKAAAFLVDNDYIGDDTFIAAYPYDPVSILPYVPEPYSKFYYVRIEEYGSYLVWGKKYFGRKTLLLGEIIRRVDSVALGRDYKTKLFITNNKLINWVNLYDRLEIIASFEQSIKPGEAFYICELRD